MLSKSKTDDPISSSAEMSAGLQVIVCSLPRTGTTSIKLALEQLGFPNVYHMSTFIGHAEVYKDWIHVIKAKQSGRDIPRSVWDNLLGGYQVVVDAPGCYFAIELAKAYPDAKVIILNRDSEKWYDSFAKTVQEMIKRRESLEPFEWMLRPCLPADASAIIRMGNFLSKSGVGLGSYGKDDCLRFFHDYYADCRMNIPADSCIEFRVQDGWAPLCEHLGVPVPGQQTADGWIQAPFPQVNDTGAFGSWVGQIQRSIVIQTRRNMALHALALFGVLGLFTLVKPFN